MNIGLSADTASTGVRDQVFDVLYRQVLALELPPDSKLSEAEVAKQLGVSRQPVRDAFFRLSQLGFLVVQPQKATRVSKIRVQDIQRARFVRTSVEIEVMRLAVEHFGTEDFTLLEANLNEQKVALDQDDRTRFHQLDDAFHRLICERAGVGYVWPLLLEHKAQTDRVRFLALASGTSRAWQEHRQIVQNLKDKNLDAAVACLREHLSQIQGVIHQLREQNHDWISDESTT